MKIIRGAQCFAYNCVKSPPGSEKLTNPYPIKQAAKIALFTTVSHKLTLSLFSNSSNFLRSDDGFMQLQTLVNVPSLEHQPL